jgi:hypothetical protein
MEQGITKKPGDEATGLRRILVGGGGVADAGSYGQGVQ